MVCFRDSVNLLVLPAASRPSMSNRISFDPKIFDIILDSCPPMVTVTATAVLCRWSVALSTAIEWSIEE